MPIKVVALDIYGTVLAFDDNNCTFPPRKGLECFLDYCQKKGIKVVTSSDADVEKVKRDLNLAFAVAIEADSNQKKKAELKRIFNLTSFDGFFKLDQGMKDFSLIVGYYDILPSELLAVGDNYNKDILSALRIGANAIYCPMYGISQGGEWDFGKIKLE